MKPQDLEALCASLSRDAAMLGCAHPDDLAPNLNFLEEALGEISRATQKARNGLMAAA